MKISWAVAGLLSCSLLFWWQPLWDHQFTEIFYNPLSRHFWAEEHPLLEMLRHALVDLLILFNGVLVAILLLKIFKPQWVVRFKAKAVVYLLLCFVLAPALVVNAILKDHWGRPRPHQLQDFGGSALYQPVWKISNQCDRNCSFVCGDCAFAFTLLALVPLVSRKKLCALLVFLLGSVLSFLRVGAGGHFLSDAILSAFIVYLVISLVYALFYKTHFFDEERMEKFFNNVHQKLLG